MFNRNVKLNISFDKMSLIPIIFKSRDFVNPDWPTNQPVTTLFVVRFSKFGHVIVCFSKFYLSRLT